MLVHAPTLRAFTRHDERLSIAREFAPALEKLREIGDHSGLEWFDCEGLERRHGIGRGTLVVLDAVIPGSYLDRRHSLIAALDAALPIESQPEPDAVVLVPAFPMDTAFGIYARLRELNHRWRVPFYEGIVMKRTDSAYPIHTRSATEEYPDWHRFLN